jgi:hypothetical protein
MLWLYIAAAGAGALLGLLWLRVLAVLAGSVILMAITVDWMTLQQRPFLEGVINVFMLLAILQFSYLAALMLSCACTRAAFRGVPASSGVSPFSPSRLKLLPGVYVSHRVDYHRGVLIPSDRRGTSSVVLIVRRVAKEGGRPMG